MDEKIDGREGEKRRKEDRKADGPSGVCTQDGQTSRCKHRNADQCTEEKGKRGTVTFFLNPPDTHFHLSSRRYVQVMEIGSGKGGGGQESGMDMLLCSCVSALVSHGCLQASMHTQGER